MLKFIMKREDPVSPEPLSEQRLGFELETASGVWLTDVWADLVVPAHGWLYVDRIERCNHGAASLLHALELSIASAARWIAVELLKDPTPPGNNAEGAALYLAEWDYTGHCLRVASRDESMPIGVIKRELATRWDVHAHRLFGPTICVSKEQALSVLIEHAAPWIAGAIEKELEEK